MSASAPASDDASSFLGGAAPRTPAARLGVAVVHDLVAAIVNGDVQPGQTLPPEEKLSQHFGVSRTVIRESVKRIEEKGLITVAPGRGTTVQPSSSWNVLDPVVLSIMLDNDDSLGVLDDLAVIRGALEGAMSAETARRRSSEQIEDLAAALLRMEESIHDDEGFRRADADFHFLVMSLSGNQLASSITRILLERARESSRFSGKDASDAFTRTLAEHRRVYEAIAAGDAAAAEEAMRAHIVESWQRRRLPNLRHG